jgi:hypothetical protein
LLTRTEKVRKLYKSVWHKLAVREIHPVPVFIFGEMRSGTNMLTDCLDRSLCTATYNETDEHAFIGYELRGNEILSDLLRQSRASHVIFKSLADSARAAELLERFPTAKVIWILRNYEDVVNSAMRKWKEHNKYLRYVIHDPDKAGWRAKNLPVHLIELIRTHYDRGISEPSARALIWYVRNVLFFEQKLDANDNVCLVRYEKLARAPEKEFQRIFAFLQLRLRPAYFKRVSTKSIRRESPPLIDDGVAELCDGLKIKLIAQIEHNGNT